MITVQVNEETLEMEPCSIQDALAQWGYNGDEIAVAVNNEFIPRSFHDQTQLQDQDRVDVVAPIQGG